MRVAGAITKTGKWWAVEIPLLDLQTQGATKAEAYEMAKDVVETMVNKKGFEVTVIPVGVHDFIVDTPDTRALMAFTLERRRLAKGLTTVDVAKLIGESSPTGYVRYEKGQVQPSVEKFFRILKAIDTENEPVLTLMKVSS
nr:hypothetical protein CKG001_10330 [Bdellovibrio sp. CKG001]